MLLDVVRCSFFSIFLSLSIFCQFEIKILPGSSSKQGSYDVLLGIIFYFSKSSRASSSVSSLVSSPVSSKEALWRLRSRFQEAYCLEQFSEQFWMAANWNFQIQRSSRSLFGKFGIYWNRRRGIVFAEEWFRDFRSKDWKCSFVGLHFCFRLRAVS